MTLTQITRREGTIDRVREGKTPVLELDLDDGQHVVSVELNPIVHVYSERKTVDWRWTAYIATPLRGAS